ncbi:MAG TPA: ABC transporter ATP-binding protein, partial [Anaerolineae bacterium]|nr:ABC transporter ATP-binding protein [Anaerolineae bacterium]
MELLVMLDVWIGLGLLTGWLAGRIWKQPRPIGLRGDLVLAGGLALLTGLADWFVLPLLGITGPILIAASIVEPLFVVVIALWVVRKIKLPHHPIEREAEVSVTSHDPNAIIWAQHLTRDFGKTRAVNGLDVAIARGEIFGLVGPDGAGKTTTLRLLAGLLNISAGAASVNGFDLQRHAETIKSKIGYMAQQFSLYGDLSVWENLDFFADLYDVTGPARRERTDRLLEFARLTEFRDRRAANLSGGMQKKLALACTLIHEPDILLLDEPTTGVDPVSRREFWDILTELHLNGTTIVVSTPYMDEAERCQHVGLMYEGQLIVCDEPQRIQARVAGDLIELRPADGQHAREILTNAPGV